MVNNIYFDKMNCDNGDYDKKPGELVDDIGK
jgi:hypothetical protein